MQCGSYQFFMGNGKVADLFCYWPAVTSTFKSQYIVVVYPLDKGGGGSEGDVNKRLLPPTGTINREIQKGPFNKKCEN